MNKVVFFKLNGLIFIVSFFILFFFSQCANQKQGNKNAKVFIENKNGKYTLIRNGRPYVIKGASGFTYLKKLNETGGNTIRTYDTANLGSILNEAEANHLTVVVGLPIIDNKLLNYFYADAAKTEAQFKACKSIIEKYKNHPAVLMWCMGNELEFGLKFRSINFYRSFNQLVDMVHEIDPDHPVTTTVIDLPRNSILNISLRTKIDIISINAFGNLHSLRKSLDACSWFWKAPYVILEWGINGPWYPNLNKTSWDAYIESTSNKKAEQYLQAYQQDIPAEDPRLLGSFVFYWGQKQEYTHTWYSLFYENGSSSETVGVMQHIWTGKWPEYSAPQIKYMLIDNKGARDNIIYKPGEAANAEIFMLKQDSSISNIKWELYHEDWYKKDNLKNLKKLTPIDSLFINRNNYKATFLTPLQEGPYRLYGTIFDKSGNFATCNTPFYVVK